jgi:hypothetical protein
MTGIRLAVPEIGTKLKLAEDWTFSLFFERRTIDLFFLLHETGNVKEENFVPTSEDVWYYYDMNVYEKEYPGISQYNKYVCIPWRDRDTKQTYCYQLTIPKESIVIVDRYYIKKGNGAFSSLTFRTESINLPGFKKKKPRFWAKLYDVNNIVYEV